MDCQILAADQTTTLALMASPAVRGESRRPTSRASASCQCAQAALRAKSERLILAMLILSLGGSVYLFVRASPCDFVNDIHNVLRDISNSLGYLAIITGNIPTLSHTFLFILFTSLFLSETGLYYVINSSGGLFPSLR